MNGLNSKFKIQNSKLALSAAAFGLVLTFAGFVIDGRASITQSMLFWWFLAAGLGGTALGVAAVARRGTEPPKLIGAALAALVSWRLAYFPVMVFSGFVAAVGELVTYSLFGVSVVYPVFFFSLYLHGFAIAWVAASVVAPARRPEDAETTSRWLALLRYPPRKLLLAAGLPALLVATLVSFTDGEDLVLFADYPWTQNPEPPPISDPNENPYLHRAFSSEFGIPSRVLFFNAGMTYGLVPETPWGGAIKGTLEAMANENPTASSTQRIRDHYLAYLAAHQRIRGEEQ